MTNGTSGVVFICNMVMRYGDSPGESILLRIGSYRFHFYSDEGNEPAHIHVDIGEGECKFCLDPVILARSINVSAVEVRKIVRLVFENRFFLIGKYDEFHRR